MIEIEIYDDNAAGQDASGSWPTKTICVPAAWLDRYAREHTKYRSAKALLAGYTFDELDGIESAAQADQVIA